MVETVSRASRGANHFPQDRYPSLSHVLKTEDAQATICLITLGFLVMVFRFVQRATWPALRRVLWAVFSFRCVLTWRGPRLDRVLRDFVDGIFGSKRFAKVSVVFLLPRRRIVAKSWTVFNFLRWNATGLGLGQLPALWRRPASNT